MHGITWKENFVCKDRPIGAVVYMQRGNLKMCLRSLDSATDTSVIAKVLKIMHIPFVMLRNDVA